MTALPGAVYIGPFDYKVKLTKNLDVLGETLNTDALILIQKKQAPTQQRDTLVHEILHAMIFSSGYAKVADLSHEDEERLVVTLSPWLTQFLRDNPEAIAYIQA